MKKIFLCLAVTVVMLFSTFPVNATTCNHIWGEWHVFNATCGDDGFKYRYCIKCDKKEEVKIPATGNHV